MLVSFRGRESPVHGALWGGATAGHDGAGASRPVHAGAPWRNSSPVGAGTQRGSQTSHTQTTHRGWPSGLRPCGPAPPRAGGDRHRRRRRREPPHLRRRRRRRGRRLGRLQGRLLWRGVQRQAGHRVDARGAQRAGRRPPGLGLLWWVLSATRRSKGPLSLPPASAPARFGRFSAGRPAFRAPAAARCRSSAPSRPPPLETAPSIPPPEPKRQASPDHTTQASPPSARLWPRRGGSSPTSLTSRPGTARPTGAGADRRSSGASDLGGRRSQISATHLDFDGAPARRFRQLAGSSLLQS